MRAVINKSTDIVIFLFYDTEYVELTESRLMTSETTALDISSLTHTIEEVDYNPLFVGGLWKWNINGGWVCTDSARLVEVLGPQIYAEVQIKIQELLDITANKYEYDSIHTACGWAGVIDDATALKNWGATCWNISKQIKEEVISGVRQLISSDEVINEMPEFILENYL